MTVSQLITLLEDCPPEATVLIDTPFSANMQLKVRDTLTAPTIVANGVSYKVFDQNGAAAFYVGEEPYLYYYTINPNTPGIPSVYIGVGNGITEIKWEKKTLS